MFLSHDDSDLCQLSPSSDCSSQVMHLLGQAEAHKLEGVRKEQELTLATKKSQRDQEALRDARAQLENLEVRMLEVQEELEREMERGAALEEEKDRLEEKVARLEGQRGEEREGTDVGINISAHVFSW